MPALGSSPCRPRFRDHRVSARSRVRARSSRFERGERQIFTFYHPERSAILQLALDLNDSRRIRPYLLAGAGSLRSRAPFNANRFEFLGGAGAKVFVSDGVFVAPEIQIGGEPLFLRFSGSLGILLGRS